MDGIDPALLGIDLLPRLEGVRRADRRTVGQLDDRPVPDAGDGRGSYTPSWRSTRALDQLWDQDRHVCRLRRGRSRGGMAGTDRTSSTMSLNDSAPLALDSVHFVGPGTDLTVGLLPSSGGWLAADFETVDGLVHPAEPPHRGGLQHARSSTRFNGHVSSDQAAVRLRHADHRPAGPFRGWPRGGD